MPSIALELRAKDSEFRSSVSGRTLEQKARVGSAGNLWHRRREIDRLEADDEILPAKFLSISDFSLSRV